jgi:hypothetical protein
MVVHARLVTYQKLYMFAVGGAADLFRRRFDRLLYEVDEVWRAKLSQCL